jgi:hypothetical protein
LDGNIIIGIVTVALSLATTIAIVASREGKMGEKLEAQAATIAALASKEALGALESRCREEWDRNSDQHKDFYKTADSVIEITASFKDFDRRITELGADVKELLRRTRKDD